MMARLFIACVVAVLLRSCQGAIVELDAIDFMHTDDKGPRQEKCKTLPEGMLAVAAIICCGHVIRDVYLIAIHDTV